MENQTYSIGQVLPTVYVGKVTLDGFNFKTGRFLLFAKKGINCVNCRLRASFFRKEDSNGTFILNLYGRRKDGREVLFTRDHIIPESRGGTKALNNLQPMCADCNNHKGDFISVQDRLLQTVKILYRFSKYVRRQFWNTCLTLKAIWRKNDGGIRWPVN